MSIWSSVWHLEVPDRCGYGACVVDESNPEWSVHINLAQSGMSFGIRLSMDQHDGDRWHDVEAVITPDEARQLIVGLHSALTYAESVRANVEARRAGVEAETSR